MDEVQLRRACRYIESWIGFQFDQSDLPGLGLAIDYDGSLVLERTYGRADIEKNTELTPKHYFRAASQSKMFTATAIMLLVEDGVLQLDEPVSKYLSWFKSTIDPDVATITIRQLLSHSSGLIRDGENTEYWEIEDKFHNEQQLKAYIGKSKLFFPPNDIFKYSNYGYSYLGLLIETITRQSYSDFITERILDKLSLKDTGTDLDDRSQQKLATGYTPNINKVTRRPIEPIPTNAMAAATGIYTTLADICRFASAHYFGNTVLLKEATKREMQRLQWDVPREQGVSYGLGLERTKIGSATLIGHNGGFPGFSSSTKFDPKRLITVSVYSNTNLAGAGYIANHILRTLSIFMDKSSPVDLKKYEGRFFGEWGATDILQLGNDLHIAFPEQWGSPLANATRLEQVSPSEFKIAEASGFASIGQTIKFEFDDQDVIKHIVHTGAKLYPWATFLKVKGIKAKK